LPCQQPGGKLGKKKGEEGKRRKREKDAASRAPDAVFSFQFSLKKKNIIRWLRK
jgi:hypothetical protein